MKTLFDYRAVAVVEEKTLIYGKMEQMEYLSCLSELTFQKVVDFKEKDLFFYLRDMTQCLSAFTLVPFEMTCFYHLYCQSQRMETSTSWDDFYENGELQLHQLLSERRD